ncbi:MAG: hypothetical protein JNM47_04455 [Hyphomonadaceae bacterium]|nr:hypothetical protein [Hyphomonadaceae bacterium]
MSEAYRISSPISYIPTHLTLIRRDHGKVVAKSSATGFLWHRAGDYFLVTNLHNVTGWDADRNVALSDQGWLPNEILVPLAFRERPGPDGRFAFARAAQGSALTNSAGEPRWLVHPHYGSKVDVAVLLLGKLKPEDFVTHVKNPHEWELATQPANECPEWMPFQENAGDDAYVIGFPFGMDGGHEFPIWKRASIASEPDLNLGGLPKLLIDTATRKGMSGSPVIVVRRGAIQQPDSDMWVGQAPDLLGVYSGRLGDDPLGVQLGVVWKKRVIDEIIDGGTLGRWPWDPSFSQP